MPWFQVGDQMHSASAIRKVAATEPAAMCLWTMAGSWSSCQGTNGVIPDDDLPWVMPGAVDLAKVLVAAGLWRRVRDGHAFVTDPVTHKIPTKETVSRDRASAADRQRRRRERVSSQGESRRDASVTTPVSHAGTRSNPSLSNPLIDQINQLAGGKALVDDDLILKTIIDLIHERTGRVLNAAQAQGIADSLLTGRNLTDPVAYIRKAIRNEPNPRARFLIATDDPEPPVGRQGCGRCNQSWHIEDDDGNDLGRCPTCHPANLNGATPA